MAGRGLDSVSDATSTGAAFVAVNKAVWSHPGGPAEAVALAEATLRSARRAA
jgi:thiamine monophosphate synthase